MVTTPKKTEAKQSSRSPLKWILGFIVGLTFLALVSLRWGGELLVADDPLPTSADASIILQGSTTGEKARIAGAVRLLQQGVTKEALLSVPPESYWGEPIPPVATAYLQKNYGAQIADRVDFCIVGPGVDSTEEEAAALDKCIRQHDWKSIVVVTSNYHSRRAGIIWRKTIKKLDPSVHLWMHEVSDPEFNPHGWWHVRLYAKTWFFEFTKLIWTLIVG
jgi:uncharacterized SAM-binding protein YcdF (DUF218 family)